MRKLLTAVPLSAVAFLGLIAPAQAATKLSLQIQPQAQLQTVQTDAGPVTVATMTWRFKCPKGHHFLYESLVGTGGQSNNEFSERNVCTGSWQTLTSRSQVPADTRIIEGYVYLLDWETSKTVSVTKTLTVT